MIEMLGVLAIIGVLSVGGIAGYSKAMEMHKINKNVSQYNNLIQGMLTLPDNVFKGNNYYVLPIAQTMNLIPQDWKIRDNSHFIDSFGTVVGFYIRNNHMVIDYTFSTTSENLALNKKLCVAMINNFTYPLHDQVYRSWIYRAYNGENYASPIYYGDAYCSGKKCIRNMTISSMHTICDDCTKSQFCVMVTEF